MDVRALAGIPMMDVPKDCKECKATCPLSRDGCPFDLFREAKALKQKVDDAGLQMPGYEQLLADLVGRSKACWREVVAEVEEDNKQTRGAIRLYERMATVLPLRTPPPAVVHSRPRPVPVPPHAPESDPAVGEAEAEAVDPKEPPVSRGSKDLYVNDEDAALEEELLQQEGVHGISVAPKKRLDTLEGYVEKVLKPIFSQAPFEGLIAVIPKRHEGSTSLVRVTAYYRGPPPKEALGLWKERKAAYAE